MSRPKNATLQPGKVLDGKWIIIELIGKGAMGEVYRAHQTNLKRDVAIKIISEDIMEEIADDPEELNIALGRFQREVQTMAQVRHTNVLTIYDYGEVKDWEESGQPHIAYIVMEYIPGNSLRFTLAEDGLDDEPELFAKWIKTYFMPIIDGVETLHNNKIIHRDLKPENIFMDGEVPKIADFGLARSQHMEAVTCSLEMLGTLAYMSPEQCADFKNADYTTDIYALGKILFEAVNGTLSKKAIPFTSVSIDNPQTTFLVEMNDIIKKATAEKPEDRYQTIQDFRSDLKKTLAGLSGVPTVVQNIVQKKTQNNKIVSDKQIKIFAVLIIAVITLVLGADIYDIFYKDTPQPEMKHAMEVKPAPGLEEKTYSEAEDKKPPVNRHIIVAEKNTVLAETVLGRDGSKLILTGSIKDQAAGTIPFYMDDQKITNFLFLKFLHTFKENISVKNGIVRHDGKIVLYIGDGSAPEDVIIYEYKTFHLKNQADGNKPVLRVTYHGAQMYAEHFGKELLTDKEWQFGFKYHLEDSIQEEFVKPQSALAASSTMTHDTSNMMHNSNPGHANENSQSVLDNMGQNIKEWVNIAKPEPTSKTAPPDPDTPVSGVMDMSRANADRQALRRFPWEGFDDVGFRTKIPIVFK